RYKGHWQGRQRSSPTSGNLHVSEGSTPKPSGSKRTSSTNSGFLGDEAHKPRCFRRINFRTSGPQEDISVIDGFREDTSNMTKWRDLRPAKSTRNCRTTRPTRPTKVLLPRSCPIDLESIMNGSMEATGAILTTAHIQSTSKVALIPRNLQGPKDKSTGPTGSEHEALESLKFQRRITGDYEFLHDVHRYFGVVRRRISLHASTKGLVPPEEGMRKNAVFTRLLPSMELLHPRVMVGPAPGRRISLITAMRIRDQEFLLPSGAPDHLQHISTDTSDLHQPNLQVLPSIDMRGQDPESS
ncbi:hypothetical protein HID58_075825, partial [Brassica napus]